MAVMQVTHCRRVWLKHQKMKEYTLKIPSLRQSTFRLILVLLPCLAELSLPGSARLSASESALCFFLCYPGDMKGQSPSSPQPHDSYDVQDMCVYSISHGRCIRLTESHHYRYKLFNFTTFPHHSCPLAPSLFLVCTHKLKIDLRSSLDLRLMSQIQTFSHN
jgi:hypothetical protein